MRAPLALKRGRAALTAPGGTTYTRTYPCAHRWSISKVCAVSKPVTQSAALTPSCARAASSWLNPAGLWGNVRRLRAAPAAFTKHASCLASLQSIPRYTSIGR